MKRSIETVIEVYEFMKLSVQILQMKILLYMEYLNFSKYLIVLNVCTCRMNHIFNYLFICLYRGVTASYMNSNGNRKS